MSDLSKSDLRNKNKYIKKWKKHCSTLFIEMLLPFIATVGRKRPEDEESKSTRRHYKFTE